MPTIAEVIKMERAASPGVIRLTKSGKFLRAYNRSAWYFHTLIAQYRVGRTFFKKLEEDVFFIGFPVERLHDVVGGRQLVATEQGFDIILRQDEVPDESGYEEWTKTIPVSQASKSDFNSLPLAGADAEREVIRRLRNFPLENKTMTECVVFLSELRQLLGNV